MCVCSLEATPDVSCKKHLGTQCSSSVSERGCVQPQCFFVVGITLPCIVPGAYGPPGTPGLPGLPGKDKMM